MTHSTTVSTPDGNFALYVAEPATEPKAAIVVIQEIFGVNADIRRKCDLLAQAGYLAVAPDMFWRMDPGLQLDADAPSSWDRGVELVIRFDTDTGVRDVQATIGKARAMVRGGKVGLTGYCLGGRMAAFAAARTDVDAAVGYYGVQVDRMLGEKDAIACPLMLHIAEIDPNVSAEVQAEIHRALDDHPLVTLHDYPGEHHGFAETFGRRRSEQAAQLADARTLAFLAEHLG